MKFKSFSSASIRDSGGEGVPTFGTSGFSLSFQVSILSRMSKVGWRSARRFSLPGLCSVQKRTKASTCFGVIFTCGARSSTCSRNTSLLYSAILSLSKPRISLWTDETKRQSRVCVCALLFLLVLYIYSFFSSSIRVCPLCALCVPSCLFSLSELHW